MNMNIVDIIIILFLLLGLLVGFREGVIKKLTSIIGLIIVIVLSFTLKNPLSAFFYENLPFIDLWGVFKGLQVFNVIFYEALAFLIISSVLTIVYRLLLGITGIIEKVLKATVILSIPSKILGAIVGLIESYIWVYVIVFVLTLPIIGLKDVYSSKYAMYILENTPVLSKYTDKTMEIYDGIYEIAETKNTKSNEEINEETMDLLLKYDAITISSAEKLIDKNKVSVNSTEFLDKYR